MPTLSPNEAAKHIGRSRRSIMRAIETGELLARRNNRNQWQIDADDLAQWAPSERSLGDAQSASASPSPTPTPTPTPEVLVLQERVRGLEALVAEVRRQQIEEKAEARQREADLEKDRDAWRTMAQRPWWRRLAG